MASHASVLIVDFGSQVTQLIARRVRETGVYCEIHPFQKAEEAFRKLEPRAVILSGGPASVTEAGSPRAPQGVFEAGLPVMAICYGQQTTAVQLGGKVEGGHAAEFGRADVEIREASALFDGIWQVGGRYPVWMSHGDRVTELPKGFSVKATSENAPFAIATDEARRIYTTMFHPEVVHTPDGAKLIRNFVTKIAGITPDWSMKAYRAEMIDKIRAQVGKARVICGLSGGVDSAVAAVLIHEAVGDQLTCVFVDHGLMRKDEASQVVDLFRGHYNIPLVAVDASETFLGALAGVSDPEVKRKTIGKLFIDVFEAEARKIGGAEFLAQGTLYPDVIESVSFSGGPSVTIKSHHNVGGLPARMNMKLVSRCASSSRTRSGCSARSSAFPTPLSAAIRSPAPASRSASPARSAERNATSCARPTRSTSRRSARRASTMRSGRLLPFCSPFAPSASWATGGPMTMCWRCAPSPRSTA